MDKVSVVIPTYNRFNYLLNTIESVKNQTYSNIEIIVVNDCSTQKEYYEYDWKANDINIIHLEQNSKSVFGFACPGGYQKNFGMKEATGTWIAFCDDDDIWLPNKLELQLKKMAETGCKMASTEAYCGYGIYDPDKKYEKYLQDYALGGIKFIYRKTKYSKFFRNGIIPPIFTYDLIRINNIVVCCSFIMHNDIYKKVGDFKPMKTADDYEYWLRCLNYGDIAFVIEPCVYYDRGHGDGQNY
jgi:teichuronic acid biosynthesis glycosyltransferase TuaG